MHPSQRTDGLDSLQDVVDLFGKDNVAVSQRLGVALDLAHGSEALQLPLLPPALLLHRLQSLTQLLHLLLQLLDASLLLHRVLHRVVVVAGDEGAGVEERTGLGFRRTHLSIRQRQAQRKGQVWAEALLQRRRLSTTQFFNLNYACEKQIY